MIISTESSMDCILDLQACIDSSFMIKNPVKQFLILDFSCCDSETEFYQFAVCAFDSDSIHNLTSKEAAVFQGGR